MKDLVFILVDKSMEVTHLKLVVIIKARIIRLSMNI